MSEDIKMCLGKIASLSIREIGRTEEDVKIRVVVPILECLGHKRTQLDFERDGIDIFIREGIPADSRVIVETKRYKVNLEKYVVTLKRQSERMNALLSVISNGAEMRIYFNSYEKEPLCKVSREHLDENESLDILKRFLLRKNLISGLTKTYVVQEFNRMWEEDIEPKLGVVKRWIEELPHVSEEAHKALLQTGIDNISRFLDKVEAYLSSYKRLVQ
ncbi:hypothetical protein KEJ47_08805 [Candidatus Bathyarchaeota archaeon]|nr:hypothetical protein [Candidatus Bathyarchaeota archaeon]